MGPDRNLLILHTPGRQSIDDWLGVEQRIRERAPDIDVRVASNLARNSVTRRWQSSRPSLVFSPCALAEYQPRGGKVYAGGVLNKLEEMERLRAATLPVPRTVSLTPGLELPRDEWGEYVVVKPRNDADASRILVVRTRDLAKRWADLSRNGQQPMLVQEFVEHVDEGNRPTAYRVLTIFGRALYAMEVQWETPRPPVDLIADDPDVHVGTNAPSVKRIRRLVSDEAIVALAEQTYRALPEIPVHAVDLLRDRSSGRLFVIEINSRGLAWHLSSAGSRRFSEDLREAMYAQFNALDRIAEVLVEKTRAEAI